MMCLNAGMETSQQGRQKCIVACMYARIPISKFLKKGIPISKRRKLLVLLIFFFLTLVILLPVSHKFPCKPNQSHHHQMNE